MKKRILDSIIKLVFKLSRTRIGLYFIQGMIDVAMEQNRKTKHKDVEMAFCVPNWLNNYRLDTFSSKEPETLDWIDTIEEGAIIWDIGANVGLYSVYAAKSKSCKVYAFEPSVFNLELLARNIYLNKVQQLVTIVPIALSDKVSESLFQMSSTQWGGALSTFGAGIDQNGQPMNEVFEYKTIGVSMQEAVDNLHIPLPKHIKMDVDGIEHFILQGGQKVLKNVNSVLVEINDDFIEQANITHRILEEAGLTLLKKCDCGSSNQFNQWWIRK
ncbi:FkbM family methyltransferase [Aquirufa salirivi]|uniref:FkbM family methyltransferase n=1 Tax=Aquirufa salirivi TaxID=3104729 RepID=A0ABW8RTL3_9BACT